jgi:hypothetical protein
MKKSIGLWVSDKKYPAVQLTATTIFIPFYYISDKIDPVQASSCRLLDLLWYGIGVHTEEMFLKYYHEHPSW